MRSLLHGLAALTVCCIWLGNSNDALYTLNTTTGVATLGWAILRLGLLNPNGLTALDGVLYMVGFTNSAVLYTLNTTTGVAVTMVGNVTSIWG